MAPLPMAGLLALMVMFSASAGYAQESETHFWRAGDSDHGAELDPSFGASLLARTTLGLGFDFNRGRYEAVRSTDTGSLTASMKLAWETITVRAALPFFGLRGPNSAGPGARKMTDFGVGDLTTSLSYTLLPSRVGLPFFEFVAKLKIPTANSNFGTQKVDVTLLANVTHDFHPIIAFVDIGYRFRGGAPYRDTLLAAAGAGLLLRDGISLWIAYDWREAPFRERGDEHELTPFVSIPIGLHLRIDPYFLIGLARSSPDWGLGSTFSWKF